NARLDASRARAASLRDRGSGPFKNADGARNERDVRRTPSMAANIGASVEIVSEPCPAATKERRGLSMERSDCCRRARAGAGQQYRAVGGAFLWPEAGAQC